MKDSHLIEDQEAIDRWALVMAYAWMRLKDYDEIPEIVRGELVLGWSAVWLERERVE